MQSKMAWLHEYAIEHEQKRVSACKTKPDTLKHLIKVDLTIINELCIQCPHRNTHSQKLTLQ